MAGVTGCTCSLGTIVLDGCQCGAAERAERQEQALRAIRAARGAGDLESRESYDLGNRCDDCGGRLGARSDSEGRIVDGCVCDGPWATPGWVGM